MTMMNSVKGFPMNTKQKKSRDKEKDKLSRRSFIMEKRKIKRMVERLMKTYQADKDKDYVFLMSLLLSIKITGRHSKTGTQNF
jgi:hypothetical protein